MSELVAAAIECLTGRVFWLKVFLWGTTCFEKLFCNAVNLSTERDHESVIEFFSDRSGVLCCAYTGLRHQRQNHA